jgi:hypothetical protein
MANKAAALKIKGVKWFRDILNDNARQYGLEVHIHLPQKTIQFEEFGNDSFIRRPEDNKLIKTLAEYFLPWPTERLYPDAYAATIENGTVVGNTGIVLTPDNYIIAETASMTGFNDSRCPSVQQLLKGKEKFYNLGHLNTKVLSIANPNVGYGHHLVESLFILLWFIACNQTWNYIYTVIGPNYDRMKEFIDALELPTSSLIKGHPKTILSADNISFFGPCSKVLLRPETFLMVEKTFIGPRRPHVKAARKFYLISGKLAYGSKLRSNVNIEKAYEILDKKGYEAIDPAEYSLTEKIDLFAQANAIVSAEGSGTNNALLFPADNCKIFTTTPPEALLSTTLSWNRTYPGLSNSPIQSIYPHFCFNGSYGGARLNLSAQNRYQYTMACARHTVAELYNSTPNKTIGGFAPTSINVKKFQELLKVWEDC